MVEVLSLAPEKVDQSNHSRYVFSLINVIRKENCVDIRLRDPNPSEKSLPHTRVGVRHSMCVKLYSPCCFKPSSLP